MKSSLLDYAAALVIILALAFGLSAAFQWALTTSITKTFAQVPK